VSIKVYNNRCHYITFLIIVTEGQEGKGRGGRGKGEEGKGREAVGEERKEGKGILSECNCWLRPWPCWLCVVSQAEVRCHAVLCKSELVAQTITSQLQDRLTVALDEFLREKRRSQNSRLSIRLHRPLSLPNDISNPAGSVRTKFLKVGQNFRPPIGHSNSAPKLGSITEGDEDELAAASATDELMRNSETSAWQSRLDHECDNDGDSVFSSSPHTRYDILFGVM